MVEQVDPQQSEETPALEAIPELSALAATLQQARIDQGLTLVQLAAQLHMGLEQLRALEQADRAALPEQVFVIAQARRVASALGVDIAEQVTALRNSTAFNQKTPVLNPEAFKPAPAPRATTPKAPARPGASSGTALPLLRGLVVLLVICAAGGGLWSQRLQLQPLLLMLVPKTSDKPVAKPAPRAAPKPPASPVLVLRTMTTSWLEVQALPGNKPLFRGMFKGEKRFPLGQGIRLLAGRPDQVQVAEGAAQPRTLGTIKDIRWFGFKPASLPVPARR